MGGCPGVRAVWGHSVNLILQYHPAGPGLGTVREYIGQNVRMGRTETCINGHRQMQTLMGGCIVE